MIEFNLVRPSTLQFAAPTTFPVLRANKAGFRSNFLCRFVPVLCRGFFESDLESTAKFA
jgi:hypothetical protein